MKSQEAAFHSFMFDKIKIPIYKNSSESQGHLQHPCCLKVCFVDRDSGVLNETFV